MSALPPKADFSGRIWNVRYGRMQDHPVLALLSPNATFRLEPK